MCVSVCVHVYVFWRIPIKIMENIVFDKGDFTENFGGTQI